MHNSKNKDKNTILKEWVDALRSDKYIQGTGELRSNNNEFCCLGVLCDIYDPSLWNNEHGYWFYYFENNDADLPEELHYELNISKNMENKLMEMNDLQDFDFNKIADYIEENILKKL